jgi:EpsI family protein
MKGLSVLRISANHRAIVVAAAITAFGICYGGVILSLINVWSTNYLYSYGFAVPLIAAYIVWTRSPTERALEPAPDYIFGIPVMLAGMTMLVTGRLAALITLEQASLVVTLTGLILLLFGRDAVKTHWFAIAYLLLMVPLWSGPIDRLQFPSQILSARIATNVLDGVGIPVFRQGITIVLPSHALAVMRECSGVNQFIALAAMVVPAAYLWLNTFSRRLALILMAVVISYLGNGIRIALVGWLAVNGLGDGDPLGAYHLVQGLGVSVLVYLAIAGCFSLLSTPNPDPPSQRRPAASSPLARRRVWVDVAVVCVMLAAGVARVSATQLDVHLRDNLGSLEPRIEDWSMDVSAQAAPVRFPAVPDDLVGAYPTPTGERSFTGTDDELIRAYRSTSGARVHLYVGYYHRQEQGKELSGDAAGALRVVASDLDLKTEAGTLGVSEVVHEQAGRRRGILFWYDINGRIVSDIYEAKGYMILDAVTRRRTNGAVVMVAWEGAAGQESDVARDHAIAFARALMPRLRRHLPS